jgi:hypothetical protein
MNEQAFAHWARRIHSKLNTCVSSASDVDDVLAAIEAKVDVLVDEYQRRGESLILLTESAAVDAPHTAKLFQVGLDPSSHDSDPYDAIRQSIADLASHLRSIGKALEVCGDSATPRTRVATACAAWRDYPQAVEAVKQPSLTSAVYAASVLAEIAGDIARKWRGMRGGGTEESTLPVDRSMGDGVGTPPRLPATYNRGAYASSPSTA